VSSLTQKYIKLKFKLRYIWFSTSNFEYNVSLF